MLYPKYVGQPRLAVHPVFDRQHREAGTVSFAGLGIDTGWPGGAVTATKIIQADDKKTVGVDGFARPDAGVPPARLALINTVVTGGMMMAGQCMADQHRIVSPCVELTIGLVDQFVGCQRLATR